MAEELSRDNPSLGRVWLRSVFLSSSPTSHLNTIPPDPEEEHPRPEYLAKLADVEERHINFVTQTTEPRPPFWRMKMPGVLISWASVLFFVILALVTVVAIILYRMSMIVALATVTDKLIKYETDNFVY